MSVENIPFKQTETVSNEYVLILLLVTAVFAVIFVFSLKYLRHKGVVLFKNKLKSKVEIIERKQLSASSQVYILLIDGKRYLFTESSKNINMQSISSSQTNLHGLADVNIEQEES